MPVAPAQTPSRSSKGMRSAYPPPSTIRTRVSNTAAPPRRIGIPFDATVFANGSPAPIATTPMNTASPRFRSTRFATTGIVQPIGPVRPSQPSTSAMTSGPPATPSAKLPPPGSGIGIMPSRRPSAIPMPTETNDSSALPLMLSPKNRRTSACRPTGTAITRQSPNSITRSEAASISASPRRTCEIMTGKSGSAIVPSGLPTNSERDTYARTTS